MAHVHTLQDSPWSPMNSTPRRKASTADPNASRRFPAISGAEPVHTPNGRVAPMPNRTMAGYMKVAMDIGDASRHQRPPSAGSPHGFPRSAHGTAPAKARRPNGLLTRDLTKMPGPGPKGSPSPKTSLDDEMLPSLPNQSLSPTRPDSLTSFASVEYSQPPTPSTRFHSQPRSTRMYEESDVSPEPSLTPKSSRRLEAALRSDTSQVSASQASFGSSPPCTRGLPPMLVEAVQQCDASSFRILKTVGIGTFGVVKLCELTGHPFVLKIMSKAHVTAYKQKDNTFSEQRVLTHLNHPFIVKLYKSLNSSLCIYMMMQYVPGGELFSFLRREKTLTLKVAQFYTAQMVLALQYLISKEIVYRDIKPENLLIDAKGYLIMTDFGFAKQVEPGGKCFTMCGTPEYMAPEVILRQPGYSFPVDWWAVGVLLYEMLVGRSPFQNNDTKKVYRGVLRGKVDYEPVVDPTARDLIRRLLIRDPAKRGVYQGGEQQTQRHRFFRGTDWDRLYLQEMDAPFEPQINSAFDTGCFEEYSEREEMNVLKLLGSGNVESQILDRDEEADTEDDWSRFAGCFVNN
eukprot:TRINITY_DN1071_c0_g2_i3.p1 TRINITY_DN1071_c0_g2~~TRINITY_DN1071_c0_g2_i3.p1  ORF type:complete len:571 (-),score=92.16 TRINITY_DN1071_c0_g2_i3:247-1959(-)